MLLPSKIDLWWAEAITRVYAPWLAPACTAVGARQRREVAALIGHARRLACLPPLDGPVSPSPGWTLGPRRAPAGQWTRGAAA